VEAVVAVVVEVTLLLKLKPKLGLTLLVRLK